DRADRCGRDLVAWAPSHCARKASPQESAEDAAGTVGIGFLAGDDATVDVGFHDIEHRRDVVTCSQGDDAGLTGSAMPTDANAAELTVGPVCSGFDTLSSRSCRSVRP